MKPEHIGPAATLAVALLARYQTAKADLPNEVIASAFEQAHQALLLGIQRVETEEKLKQPPL